MDDPNAQLSVFPKVDNTKEQLTQTSTIISAPPTIPPKPIIYEGKKPNFQKDPPDQKKLIKKLVELDVGLHVGIAVLFLILIGFMISFGGRLQLSSKNAGNPKSLAKGLSGEKP